MEKIEKFNTFAGNPNSNYFQQKRQSKTLPYAGSKIEIIKILDTSQNFSKPDSVNLNECDFDEPDLTINNPSVLKMNLSICASKNKNFSNHSFAFLENYKDKPEKLHEEHEGHNKKHENEHKENENFHKENELTYPETEEHFIKEIQKDYETILSKDLDFEETLNNMEVISISSMENPAEYEEGPNINNKIPNAFTFENSQKKENEICDKMVSSGISSPGKSPRSKKKSALNSLIQNHPFRALIFSPYIGETIFMKHLLQTYKGLVYAKKCLKVQISEYQREKSVNLKEKKGNRYKTLFLDLDETLIHACSISENPQHVIKGTGPYGSEILIGFNVRPYCLEFLKKLSQFYEIVIFTASMSNYAHAIINFLDPFHQYISEILTRSSCIRTKNGFFIKDLRIIKNRELKNMVIVDNLSHSFGFQIDNGIPILEFLNDRKDRELKHLYDHLLEGLYVDDVRIFNRKRLQLNILSEMRIEELRIL